MTAAAAQPPALSPAAAHWDSYADIESGRMAGRKARGAHAAQRRGHDTGAITSASLFVVGLTTQLFASGPGPALAVAQAVLASSCIIGMFAVILRTPFVRGGGDTQTVISNLLGGIGVWLTAVGIVVLTWATQHMVVAAIATAVFVCCFCIVAESAFHRVSSKPESAR